MQLNVTKTNVSSFVIGLAVTIVASLFPYPIYPEWYAVGLPIPWYARYIGPLMILMQFTCWPCLIADIAFWSYLIRKIILRYYPDEDLSSPFDEPPQS